MNKLFVEVDNPCVQNYQEPVQWGDWRRSSIYNGVRVFDGDYSDHHANYRNSIEVDFDVVPGMVVYPVLVQYGSGDSFGYSSGDITLVAVFDDDAKARNLIAAIRSAGPREYTIVVDDKEYYTGTWTGYFETLEDVIIETEVVRV